MPVKVTAPPLPQAPHNFHHTPEDILAIADGVIARNRALEDRIGALKPEECTFDSVVRPLALDEGAFDTESDPACFLSSVSTDKAVRDAATEATKRISVGETAGGRSKAILSNPRHLPLYGRITASNRPCARTSTSA